MGENVLNEIKKLSGLPPEDDSFDTDLLIYLNGLQLVLSQLGIKLSEGVVIDKDTTWEDLIDSSMSAYVFLTVKMYLSSKVRKIFDPPQSGTAMQSLDDLIAEYEWRLNVEVDPSELVSE